MLSNKYEAYNMIMEVFKSLKFRPVVTQAYADHVKVVISQGQIILFT